jgi:hypothetical protein
LSTLLPTLVLLLSVGAGSEKNEVPMIVLASASGGLAPSSAFRVVSFLLIFLLCCSDRVVGEVDSEFKSVSPLFDVIVFSTSGGASK